MRTLLIGFQKRPLKGYGQLQWQEWKAKHSYNIGDYQRVIVNLNSIQTGEQQAGIDWPQFAQCFREEKIFELLENQADLIFVGDPTFDIDSGNHTIKPHLKTPFVKILPLEFTWDKDGGKQIHISPDIPLAFANYLKPLREWKFALKNFESTSRFLFDENSLDQHRSFQVIQMAANGSGRPLAFGLVLTDILQNHFGANPSAGRMGVMMFLPNVDIVPENLAEAILQLYEEEAQLTSPSWIDDFTVPGQDNLDSEIGRLRDEIKKIESDISDLILKRDHIRQPLGLLYETGKPLEKIVLDILQRLGAEVEAPHDEENEDGWITVQLENQKLEGVLEIKSTRNRNFDEHGLNQVGIWKVRGVVNRQIEYKGIYIGAADIKSPPSERPYPFSNSFASKASLLNTVILRCDDLYEAYRLFLAQELDVNAFWKSLFATSGIFSLSSMRTRKG